MASTEIPSVSPTPMEEASNRTTTLSAADIAVLVVYFILILAVGLWVGLFAHIFYNYAVKTSVCMCVCVCVSDF